MLSPSTRDNDQGDNFAHYRSIDTLTDYVLVDPAARTVEHRRRVADDQWLTTFATRGPIVFDSLEVSVPMEAFFADIGRLASASR